MRAPLAVRQTMRATLVLGFEEAGEALGGVEAEMLLADDGVELQEALHSPHDVTGVADEVLAVDEEQLVSGEMQEPLVDVARVQTDADGAPGRVDAREVCV